MDQRKAELIAELAPHLGAHHRGVGRDQVVIVACLVGAGLFTSACVAAFAFGREGVSTFVLSMPWYTKLVLFGLSALLLLMRGLTVFSRYNLTVRAGERAHLILLFKGYAELNRTFAAKDIVAMLRSLPDPLDTWAVAKMLRSEGDAQDAGSQRHQN